MRRSRDGRPRRCRRSRLRHVVANCGWEKLMSIERDTTKSIPGSTGRSSEPVSGSAMASGRETEFAKRAADAVGDDVTEGRGKNRLDGRGAGAPNDAGTSTSTSNRTNKGQWRAAQLLLLFTILYVSVNMRAPLVGVGPV